MTISGDEIGASLQEEHSIIIVAVQYAHGP